MVRDLNLIYTSCHHLDKTEHPYFSPKIGVSVRTPVKRDGFKLLISEVVTDIPTLSVKKQIKHVPEGKVQQHVITQTKKIITELEDMISELQNHKDHMEYVCAELELGIDDISLDTSENQPRQQA